MRCAGVFLAGEGHFPAWHGMISDEVAGEHDLSMPSDISARFDTTPAIQEWHGIISSYSEKKAWHGMARHEFPNPDKSYIVQNLNRISAHICW